MPDLGNLLIPSPLTPSRCPNLKPMSEPCDPSTSLCPASVKPLAIDDAWCGNSEVETCDVKNGMDIMVHRRSHGGALDVNKKSSTSGGGKCLDDYVKAWVEKKVESGIVESRCFLPFLVGAPKLVECRVCHQFVYPGEEVLCSVRGCRGVYHLLCAKKEFGFSTSRKFKCPHHACFICKQRLHWRCVRCSVASHDKCAAWPLDVIHLGNQPGLAVCWRHPSDWRLEKMDLMLLLNEQHAAPTGDIEDVFCRLPLPYVDEEFKIDIAWKDEMENKVEPAPYVHIKRNLYLIKKKRDGLGYGIGCTNCRTTCSEDCVCRVQCISCSKACRCSEVCTNRPFRKEKRIKVVKTELCGWGVQAAESISKGDFVIEYIGEVIDDASCEQRLWDMKYKGVQNFYMCEIRKNFTIDATFKGNSSRFLNHSCNPNCKLEKWQVEGETRVGVFAARSIKVGEPLTYDYRFVQFGPEVKCCCGASNCQGYLGTKRKIGRVDLCWGSKRKRSAYIRLGCVTV